MLFVKAYYCDLRVMSVQRNRNRKKIIEIQSDIYEIHQCTWNIGIQITDISIVFRNRNLFYTHFTYFIVVCSKLHSWPLAAVISSGPAQVNVRPYVGF